MKPGDLVRFLDTDLVPLEYKDQIGVVVGEEYTSKFPNERWNVLVLGHICRRLEEGKDIELITEAG
jgi:hypothetical protein